MLRTLINMDKETGIKKKYEFTIDVLNNDLFLTARPWNKTVFIGVYDK
jgi:hypothetical protein